MLGTMSAGVDDPLDPASTAVPTRPVSRRGEGVASVEVCPFLRSNDGAWSTTHSTRDLRCWAVNPAALPTIAKQRQTCLVAAHAACATFLAASAPDSRWPPVAGEHDSAGLWPDTRPVPVSLDPVHGRPVVGVAGPRSGGQALLVALMVLAFLVVVIARTTSPSGAGTAPGSSGEASMPAVAPSSGGPASPAASPRASATALPSSIVASPSPTASASASATPAPSASPSASAQTYRVRSGDTLSSIAARYGTTVKALAAANGITDVRTIHVGQVLVIP